MSWNYRLVKHPSPVLGKFYYAVHEVYYNEDGSPKAMSTDSVSFGAETPEEVIQSLEMALNDAKQRPIFEPPSHWI